MIRTEAKTMTARTSAPVRTGEVILPFDYQALSRDQAKLAKDAAEFIESRHKKMASSVIEIGRKLAEVKASLGHGNFTGWVGAEFTMSMRTAQSYMAAAAGVGAKSEIVSHLPVMTLLEVAKSPEPIRAKVLEKMESAHKAEAPLAVDAVKNALYRARIELKEAALEAKLSPAQKRKRKEERERERVKWERLKIERGKAEADRERRIVRLAERLLTCMKGDDTAQLAEMLTSVDISSGALASRLTNGVYGQNRQNILYPKPRTVDEWNAYIADLEAGEHGAGLAMGAVGEPRDRRK
jgi:hypothetical protein